MEELYRLTLHDLPYVIWSYVIIWVGLAGYVLFILRRLGKLSKEIKVLQETVDAKIAGDSGTAADSATKREV